MSFPAHLGAESQSCHKGPLPDEMSGARLQLQPAKTIRTNVTACARHGQAPSVTQRNVFGTEGSPSRPTLLPFKAQAPLPTHGFSLFGTGVDQSQETLVC